MLFTHLFTTLYCSICKCYNIYKSRFQALFPNIARLDLKPGHWSTFQFIPLTERIPLYSWRLSRGLFIAVTQHCKRRMAPPTPHQLRRLRKVCAERSYSAIRRNLADFSYWYWGPFLCKGISRRENTQIAFVRFQEKTTHLRTYGPMVGIEGMKNYFLLNV